MFYLSTTMFAFWTSVLNCLMQQLFMAHHQRVNISHVHMTHRERNNLRKTHQAALKFKLYYSIKIWLNFHFLTLMKIPTIKLFHFAFIRDAFLLEDLFTYRKGLQSIGNKFLFQLSRILNYFWGIEIEFWLLFAYFKKMCLASDTET